MDREAAEAAVREVGWRRILVLKVMVIVQMCNWSRPSIADAVMVVVICILQRKVAVLRTVQKERKADEKPASVPLWHPKCNEISVRN